MSLVVSAVFRQNGIPSIVLDGCEAGILTTAQHGEAMALPEGEARIKELLLPSALPRGPGHHGVHGVHERRDSDHAREERV